MYFGKDDRSEGSVTDVDHLGSDSDSQSEHELPAEITGPAAQGKEKDKNKHKQLVRLNRAIILQGISRVHIDTRDTVELDKQFPKVTHLHLQRKGIDVLDSLHLFHNLTVLYLYENRIGEIDGLENATRLELLYLQKNKLDRVNGLLECKKLRKLFLGHNRICIVEGLEQLVCLQELHVENQRLEEGEQLLFDPSTLDLLSTCLQVLNISGNQMKSLEDFAGMQQLHTFKASDNRISNLDNTSLIVSTLKRLKNLDLRGNPIAKSHKYKEKLIGYGESLELLDDKVVPATTRNFIKRFCRMKAKNLERVVDSYGGTPNLTPSFPMSTVTSDMTYQYSSPPAQVPQPKFEPKNQQKQVDQLLRRLYPKERKVKSDRASDLQSQANQLLKVSGTSKLVNPQEISIPQFVLASSTALKGELGLMSEGEMEEARAVTRGTPPATAQSVFDLRTSSTSSDTGLARGGVQSVANLLGPFTSSTMESARLAAERIYMEQIDPEHRIAEMNRHLFGTPQPKKKLKKKLKVKAEKEKAPPLPEREISPTARYSIMIPSSPNSLMNQIKSPPNMKEFDVSRTGSHMELGTMTPLSLRGVNPSKMAMNEPSSPDPFEGWVAETMVEGKHGLRPKGQPEFQPDGVTSRLEEIAKAQAELPWPPEGITQAHGRWLAQQERQPVFHSEREEHGVVWPQPPDDAYQMQVFTSSAQHHARERYIAYQKQMAELRRQKTEFEHRGSSLQAVGAGGQTLSLLQQQYMLGLGQPLDIRGQEFLSLQKMNEIEANLKASISEPVQPYVTQVYELPPWPHILRNLGAKDPKVTFMP